MVASLECGIGIRIERGYKGRRLVLLAQPLLWLVVTDRSRKKLAEFECTRYGFRYAMPLGSVERVSSRANDYGGDLRITELAVSSVAP